ncbi:MAG: oligosaccharide flippase family protein [Eubacteriales bacterium]|nr:oligosaccharide flippase family protein [Eubacteriales bacterium]
MRAFTKSVLVITIFAILTRLIGFVFRIFLSRLLGAEMLGVYQMALNIFMILLTIICTGLPLVLSREIAKDPANHARTRSLTMAGLFIGIVTALILCAAVLIGHRLFALIFTDQRCLAILIITLPALIASSIYSVLRAIWWGEKKFFLLGLTELIEQIARVVLFVPLLGIAFYFADMAHIAAWSFSAACIVSALVVIIIFRCTRQHLTTAPQPRQFVRPILKAATPITSVRLFSSLTIPLVTILLPLRLMAAGWDNSTAIAHLGIISGMTLPLLTIPSTVISALATALVPELSNMINQQQWSAVRRQIRTVVRFTIFINFCFIPLYLALGAPLGQFLYADAYSGIYLARSAWVMLPMSLSQITNTTLNAMNHENITIRNYAIGTLLLLPIIWFMPAVIGADAVLLGMGISMTVSTTLNLLAIRRVTNWRGSPTTLPTIITYLVIGVPVFALAFFGFQFGANLPLVLNLFLAGTVAESAFFGLCWTTNMITIPLKRQ